ncbi:MAG: FG-GAP-like repeat-containing protein [Isosphaeraceae bacterium]
MPFRLARWIRSIIALFLLGIIVAAGGAGYHHYARWRAESALAQARRDVAAGLFGPARDRLLALPASAPGRDEVDYLIGVCEAAQGDSVAAIGTWGRIPPRSRYAARAAVRRVRLALPLGHFAAAEDLAAAFDDPQFAAEARQTCAFILKVEGRATEARRVFEDGWRYMPSAVASLREIWRLDHQPLDVELSRDELTRAGAKVPDDDRVWLGRANLAIWEGRFDEAARWLDQCLHRRAADPAVWRAWLFRARAADDCAALWRALEHLTTADLEATELPAIRAWLASRSGRPDLERPALEERVKLRPEDLASYDRLAALCAGTPDALRWRSARAEVVRAAARTSELLFGDDPVGHAAELARKSEELGRRFDARCWWTLHAQAHPGSAEAAAALARPGALAPDPATPPRTLAALLAAYRPAVAAPSGAPRSARSGEPPRFRDDAAASGLRFVYETGGTPRTPPMMMGGGIALLDYDGDGWLDVYCLQGGVFPPVAGPAPPAGGDRLFRNRGDGTFDDATARAGLVGVPGGYGYGAAVGDVDRDGHPDLLVTRWRSYALYRNNGNGTFADVTDRWGLGGDRDWPTSAAFADLDNDGDLDLYVCHYLRFNPADPAASSRMPGLSPLAYSPLMYESVPDHLFRNDGGRFVDVSQEAGIADPQGRGLGVVACDLDGDGRVDLFVANDLTANALYLNRGGLRFEETGHLAGVAASALGGYQAGMGIACGDIDGDGRPDLAVTNFFGESTSLFHNEGGGLFLDRSDQSGLALASRYRLGFGAAFLDTRNLGRLDLATANGHVVDNRPKAPFAMRAQLLLGSGDGRFVDASDIAGELWSTPRVARGLAVGDLDNDGRLDLVIVAQDGPLVFGHNQSPPRHFVTVALEGRASNRDAVGARVLVRSGQHRQVAWRMGGGSYLSASDPRLHFGLDGSDRVDVLEVAWPSGKVDRFAALAADRAYQIREGDPQPTVINRRADGLSDPLQVIPSR